MIRAKRAVKSDTSARHEPQNLPYHSIRPPCCFGGEEASTTPCHVWLIFETLECGLQRDVADKMSKVYTFPATTLMIRCRGSRKEIGSHREGLVISEGELGRERYSSVLHSQAGCFVSSRTILPLGMQYGTLGWVELFPLRRRSFYSNPSTFMLMTNTNESTIDVLFRLQPLSAI